MGRGLQHFLDEGARLVPPPETKDAYEDEAHRLWAVKAKRGLVGGSVSEPEFSKARSGAPEGLGAAAEQTELAFNIGRAPLTPAGRKRAAERLYATGATMERIAKAMGVNVATISRDLEGFCTVQKPPRPKGGRPKG